MKTVVNSEKKTIIFGMPKRFGFHKLIIKNLEIEGFSVVDVCFDDENFEYKNLFERLMNFYKKKALNDLEYKVLLKFKHQKHIEERLHAICNKVHYALLIRPDLYHTSVINLIKNKASKLVGYQWDGISRFPKVKKLIHLFDLFYVFDKDDESVLGVTKSITNFYFDSKVYPKNEFIVDLYFIGVYIENRIDDILLLIKYLKGKSINIRVDLLTTSQKQINMYGDIDEINFFHDPISYRDVLDKCSKAKVLVDFVNKDHTGLSFRCFEALGTNRKLITTNTTIKHYDFYHSNNIFILGEDKLEDIENFIKTPYYKLPESIIRKYEFKNWLIDILN